VEVFCAHNGIKIYLESFFKPEELPQIKETLDFFFRNIVKAKQKSKEDEARVIHILEKPPRVLVQDNLDNE
jgi:hypothetical protein